MSDVKLGQIITGEAYRDAVHVAIFPATAGQDLYSGNEVAIKHGTKDVAISKQKVYGFKPIGIVDPFINKTIKKDERFYIFLFPNTVIGMRHHWQHPDFPEETTVSETSTANEVLQKTKKDSITQAKEWLRNFADQWSFHYEDLFNAIREGDYIVAYGTDLHSRGELGADYDLFWQNLEIVTGEKFTEEHKESIGWSCSC